MTSLLDKINKLGLKMTDQRRTIVKVLAESHDHPDVELVYQRVAKIDSKIGIATVYRTIKLFEENNIIEKHDFKRTGDLDMSKFQMSIMITLLMLKMTKLSNFKMMILKNCKRKLQRSLDIN